MPGSLHQHSHGNPESRFRGVAAAFLSRDNLAAKEHDTCPAPRHPETNVVKLAMDASLQSLNTSASDLRASARQNGVMRHPNNATIPLGDRERPIAATGESCTCRDVQA